MQDHERSQGQAVYPSQEGDREITEAFVFSTDSLSILCQGSEKKP